MDATAAATRQRFDEETYTCGLNYARSLNFTQEQYEEALKRIDRPDNANQLLVALIDVSSQQDAIEQPAPLTFQEQEDFLVDNKSSANTNSAGDGVIGEFTSSSSSCSSLTTTTTSSSGISTSGGHGSRGGGGGTSFTLPSAPSTANQSLESLSQQHTRSPLTRTSSSTSSCSTNGGQLTGGCGGGGGGGGDLKKIYVDGSNVAMTHGKDVTFSWHGIKLCVDWFRARQHHVRVLVPENKTATDCNDHHQAHHIIEHLDECGVLVRTPSGHNDDLMIIEAARQNQGIIVSNDQYRDERARRRTAATSGEELDQFVNSSRLAYVFVDDLFIPAADPQGRNGPSLDEFLRHEPAVGHLSNGRGARQHQKLGKTRSYQMPRHTGGGGGGGGGGSRNNYSRAYNAIYRHPQQQHHHNPQQSIHVAGHQYPQPDFTSSRQIHSWQGPTRPSFESQPAFDYKQYPPVARGPCFEHPAAGQNLDNSRHTQQQQQLQEQASIWPAFLRR